jgi:hypothetical protein
MRSSDRPAFVVAIRNMGKTPLELRVASLRAELMTGKAKNVAIKVHSYDELVEEAEDERKTRLVIAALGGVANSMAAANAGHVRTTGSYSGAGYGGTYSATTYDPYRVQAAQRAASAETASNMDAIQADGEQQLAALERTIIKDHTLLPGEWFGGTVVIDAPQKSEAGRAEYLVTIPLEGDEHTFRIAQSAAGS